MTWLTNNQGYEPQLEFEVENTLEANHLVPLQKNELGELVEP